MPWASSRSRMCGTAAADSSLLTVTRTSSEPALLSALTWATVPSMSAVSVLVIDWTTIGDVPPMETAPTFTVRECLRDLISALYPEHPKPVSEPCARGGFASLAHRATFARALGPAYPARLSHGRPPHPDPAKLH